MKNLNNSDDDANIKIHDLKRKRKRIKRDIRTNESRLEKLRKSLNINDDTSDNDSDDSGDDDGDGNESAAASSS